MQRHSFRCLRQYGGTELKAAVMRRNEMQQVQAHDFRGRLQRGPFHSGWVF